MAKRMSFICSCSLGGPYFFKDAFKIRSYDFLNHAALVAALQKRVGDELDLPRCVQVWDVGRSVFARRGDPVSLPFFGSLFHFFEIAIVHFEKGHVAAEPDMILATNLEGMLEVLHVIIEHRLLR